MNVTCILLSSSLVLWSVLRSVIFHNFKNISLADQIFGNLEIYVYIYKERDKDGARETKKENTKKTNRKEVWFNFHIRYRGGNIAKGLPPFSKTWRSMQNLKHLCYEILNFIFDDK